MFELVGRCWELVATLRGSPDDGEENPIKEQFAWAKPWARMECRYCDQGARVE